MTRMDLYPLSGPVDRESFCDWDEIKRLYRETTDVRMHFPGYSFNDVKGDHWHSHGSCIDVDAGYEWDGPSGPAINGETNVIGSKTHDIICTKVNGAYPLSGYFRRHTLYVKINRVQGETRIRAATHWAALAAGNWIYAVFH